MTVLRPGIDEIHELAAINHFSIRAGEEASYDALFQRILNNYDQLDATSLPQRTLSYPDRAVGERPVADDNFCNAFVRRCRIQGQSEGLLKGKRIALKDSIGVAGMPITCGSGVLDYTAAEDASIVTRMLDAGGDIVAIVNMDNLAFSGAGDTSFYGPTFNPHRQGYLAGGSSGGSAAALFSGEVDMSIGCDQAGSIRIPASWCGVVGLKPTFGLVPYTGILGYDRSFDHTGPMARNVHDTALLLDVIAGADGRDPHQTSVPRQEYVNALQRKDLAGVRIGVLKEGFGTEGAEADVDELVRAATRKLAALGAQVSDVSLPAHAAAGGIIWGVFAEGVTATFQSNGQGHHWSGAYDPSLSEAFGRGMQLRGDALPMQCKFNLMLGTYMRTAYHGRFYAKAQSLRAVLRASYDALLRDYDVLVTPTTPMKAHQYRPDLNPEQLVLAGWNMVANTAPFNMTGHPSLSVPCGSSDGLPVGMMLTGRHFDDAGLLAVAHVYEQAGN